MAYDSLDECECEYSYDMDGRYLDYKCHWCDKLDQEEKATKVSTVSTVSTVSPWAYEKSTINLFLTDIQNGKSIEEQLDHIKRLFYYIQTISPFVLVFPKFRAAVVAKATELKGDPRAEVIHGLLDETIEWISTLE